MVSYHEESELIQHLAAEINTLATFVVSLYILDVVILGFTVFVLTVDMFIAKFGQNAEPEKEKEDKSKSVRKKSRRKRKAAWSRSASRKMDKENAKRQSPKMKRSEPVEKRSESAVVSCRSDVSHSSKQNHDSKIPGTDSFGTSVSTFSTCPGRSPPHSPDRLRDGDYLVMTGTKIYEPSEVPSAFSTGSAATAMEASRPVSKTTTAISPTPTQVHQARLPNIEGGVAHQAQYSVSSGSVLPSGSTSVATDLTQKTSATSIAAKRE